MPLGLFKECIMPIFFILIVLSLIIYRTINRAEFYNYKFVVKQITSPFVSSLIVLKNGSGGLTLITLFVLSLSSPLSAEYLPKQPSIQSTTWELTIDTMGMHM